MAKHKKDDGGGGGGAPAWMATFSDLMNLLLCFFVLLFSMSSVDANKWEQVVASMSNAFSIFSAGSTTIGNGSLVGIGTTQLSNLDENYDTTGQSAKDLGEDQRDSADSQTKDPDAQTGGKTPEEDPDSGQKDQNEASGQQDKDKDKDKDNDNIAASDDKQDAGKKDDADQTAGQTDQDKQAGQTLVDQLAALGRAETEEMLDSISEMTERYNIDSMIEIAMDSAGRYVELTLSGSLLFDSGSAELQTSCLPLLSKIGDILKVYSDHEVEIIGHTDNVPIKSSKFADNDILSSARAISAAQYLVKEKNIDVKRLSWTGRGEYEPVASNATAEGRSRNRRIEIRIYNSFNSNN